MSNWIDIEILPPKEGICANKIIGQPFVIFTYFEDGCFYPYKESFESCCPSSYDTQVYDWAIHNNAVEIIYKYKYE